MDWSLVIFISIVVFFSYRGYKKGLLKSLARILSLLAGYITAIFYTSRVSEIIASNFQLQGIAAFICASLLLFCGAAFAVNILIKLLEKLRPGGKEPSTLSAYGGATAGAVVGVIVSILVVWSYAFSRDLHPTDALPEASMSGIENLTNRMAGNAVKTAMSWVAVKPEIARLSVALVESPAKITQQATRLSRSSDLSDLLGNPDMQKALNTGDVKAVQEIPAFQQLAKNPDMQALVKSAGMLDESTVNPQSVETALAIQVSDIWQRTQRVKNDKRVQEILNNPEFIRSMQSGNPIDLMTNSTLLELADIILSDSATSEITRGQKQNTEQTSSFLQQNPKKEASIYTWTDEKGVLHLSNIEGKVK